MINRRKSASKLKIKTINETFDFKHKISKNRDVDKKNTHSKKFHFVKNKNI
jgi:hypothetical protein